MIKKKSKKIILWTDGGYSSKSNTGGWGAVLLCYEDGELIHSREMSGWKKRTTNNEMELYAALQGLSALNPRGLGEYSIIVCSDSTYVVNTFSKWAKKWEANNWHNGGGVPKNIELIKQIYALSTRYRVKWEWVKGHNGNHWNERADYLATSAYVERRG